MPLTRPSSDHPPGPHQGVTVAGRQLDVISLDGRWFVYDCGTAVLLEVSAAMGAGLVDPTQELPVDEITTLLTSITALEMLTMPAARAAAEATGPMTTVALGIEEGCNLACTYCYNGAHYERTSASPQAKMHLDVAMRTVSAALHQLGTEKRLSLQLIGGEPLLRFRFIQELITSAERMALALGCEVRFSLNTNGIGLTKSVVDFLVAHRVGIAISIDGDPAQHDLNRLVAGPSRRGSYELVARNLPYFVERYKTVYGALNCRLTVADPEMDLVRGVSHLVSLGFNSIGIGVALADMLRQHPDRERVVTSLISSFRRLKDFTLGEYRQGRFFRVSLFNDTMFSIYAHRPKFVPCGAMRRYAGVSADGTVVPCHRYIGTTRPDRWTAGKGDEAGLRLENRRTKLSSVPFGTVYDDNRGDAYECRSCWARHLCGGECYEIRDVWGEDFHRMKKYYCDMKRELFRMGTEMLITLQQERPDDLRRLMEMNAALKNRVTPEAVSPRTF